MKRGLFTEAEVERERGKPKRDDVRALVSADRGQKGILLGDFLGILLGAGKWACHRTDLLGSRDVSGQRTK